MNQYCKVTNCAVAGGTCTTKPAALPAAKPVCGCDKVTYWNESVAAHDYGVNVDATGTECPKGPTTSVACTTNVKCDGKRSCNLGVGAANQCNAIITGTCWGLPVTCSAASGQFSQCGGGGSADCFNPCETIRDQQPFYFDARCPAPPP